MGFTKRFALFSAASAFTALVNGSTPTLAADLKGTVKVDGSSTVFPITEAMAEEFQKVNHGIKVTVGVSGTGGGYKKFTVGEIDVADASRSIKPDEQQKCKESNIEFMELPIAYDGITIVINPKNTFVNELTFDQLKKLWEPGSKVVTWKDLNAAWPDQKIKLYGPGSDSGTFDYFTEDVVGKAKASRSDYTSSEDDNVLVKGVEGDTYALGYFGYAYFKESKGKLKAVAIDHGKGATLPDDKAIASGSYPLSRPLFITVNKKSAERPEVDAFVKYYLSNAKELAHSVGYTSLPDAMYSQVMKRYEAKQVGTWQASTH